jgi:cysteine desulfurase
MKRIYLDHAATTYLDPKVKAAMEPFWTKNFGNASTIYKEGIEARNAMNAARKKIASLIGANPDEIIFTNGGTESDNLAILGVARFYRPNCLFFSRLNPQAGSDADSKNKQFGRRPHIITSKIEHHAVFNSCEALAREGFKVTYLNVNKDGIVDLKELKKSLKKDTILVSIMYANNEIGTVQPIKEIAKVIRNFRKAEPSASGPLFHTDAIQAAGYLDLNVQKLGVDLMSVNASKIYGPKGIGFSYIKRGVRLSPILYGGSQEKGLRPGTENIPEIAGLAKALEISQGMREKESRRLITLRDYLVKSILKKIPRSSLNGHPVLRLPNNVNMTISGVEGESLILYLDAAGISCSTGSACTSSSLEPSHVIVALGKSKEDAHCSVRFTLGRKTQKRDMDYLLKILPDIVKKLRKTSAI